MKIKKLFILNISLCIVLIFSGMIITDPYGSKTQIKTSIVVHNPDLLHTNSAVVYVDSLNGVNDTIGLRSRGYIPKLGPENGPPGNSPNWFQGNETFNSYEGPDTGYVAANFNLTTGTNPIDLWLISPVVTGTSGDTLSFFERSPAGSVYADSIRVYWSASGDTVPGSASFIELGRFRTTTTGNWAERRFAITDPGASGRFAINYRVIEGGPAGNNSDFVGIDLIRIFSGVVGISNNNNSTPGKFSLSQNYPNPFNPTTRIDYSLPVTSRVKLSVFDISGKEVAVLFNGYKPAGNYKSDFNAGMLASGIYFYKIETAIFTETKKMILIK